MPSKHLVTALLTDTGRVRTNNEDALGENTDLGLLVLADGMGGYNAGEIASGIAVASILETVKKEYAVLDRDSMPMQSAEATLLQNAVETAHATIYHVSQSQPQCAGMGTTVVCCIFHEMTLTIAYVGDSRVYRLRGGVLTQLTRDHSLLEELVSRGHYTREEAVKLVRKNIVTRALGVEAEVTVDLLEEPLELGDIILLCSDGLTDMVPDELIGAALTEHASDLRAAAKMLVDSANDNGGKDNISVVIGRIDSGFKATQSWRKRLSKWF